MVLMMRYDQIEAMAMMNELGANQEPFVFFIDYEMNDIMIEKPETVSEIYYDFNGYSRYPNRPKEQQRFFLEKFPISYAEYKERYDIVKSSIARGDSYLTNLTFATRIHCNWSLEEIFYYSQAQFKGYLPGEFVFFSPEKFVEIENGVIRTFPMKGTIRADVDHAAETLINDQKEMAEHSTIVDLMRNDISRFCSDVRVERFRYIDRLSSPDNDLLQASSEITGQIQGNMNGRIGDILFSLLPAGSISGAPKAKTANIIDRAEIGPRGYYTGICGYYDGKVLKSGVMIRMIQMDDNKDLYFHSGGGVTYQSDSEKEYQELLDKIYVPITRNHQNTGWKDLQHSLS